MTKSIKLSYLIKQKINQVMNQSAFHVAQQETENDALEDPSKKPLKPTFAGILALPDAVKKAMQEDRNDKKKRGV